jgi:hypothetical protein
LSAGNAARWATRRRYCAAGHTHSGLAGVRRSLVSSEVTTEASAHILEGPLGLPGRSSRARQGSNLQPGRHERRNINRVCCFR